MVIGNLPNYQFYNGYEGEPEVILRLNGKDSESLHIWEGYFADILRKPNLDGHGWKGFTRDYQQCEKTFSNEKDPIKIDIDEYLEDLNQYKGKNFDYEETADCLNLIINFLAEAKKDGHSVTVELS